MSKPPPTDLFAPHEGRSCLDGRLAQAGDHVSRDEWAAGHSIARKLLHCAEHGGCGSRADCRNAALSLMDEIRTLVGS